MQTLTDLTKGIFLKKEPSKIGHHLATFSSQKKENDAPKGSAHEQRARTDETGIRHWRDVCEGMRKEAEQAKALGIPIGEGFESCRL